MTQSQQDILHTFPIVATNHIKVYKRKTQITKAKKRLYNIHYKLRKADNKINSSKKFVTKRCTELTVLEQKWIDLLIASGYGVCDDLFNETKNK